LKLALKVDVDTYRGTREGVPRLVEALARHGATATFLFSLGPDHTGRALRRVFRRGFFGKVRRTSVLEHYGVRTLLYGTVLPGPDIGRRCAAEMRAARDAGHEVGIHAWDHVEWQDGVGSADAQWTALRMQRACDRFHEIFGEPARTHGAAGWQMNADAWRLTQRLGFDYCSDTRGTEPFIPIRRAEIFDCPQLPTTLPTLDELIGLGGVTPENVAERLLELSRDPLPTGHVYTLHAELEGGRLLPAFERLLAGWKAMGYTLVTTRSIFESLDRRALPRCVVDNATIPGRSGTLAIQSRPFLA
jgi:peptidoglycan/xylan/chitin deacetylase (PgdA/CDA1 family)